MNYKILIIIILVAISNFTSASDVFVETERQDGQGIMRAIGGKCFVYTPAHVVARSNDIFVYTRFAKDLWGELITTYPQDLALIKLKDTQAESCSESSWRDGGERVNTILDVIKSGQLQYRHKKGRVEVFDVEITNKALHSTFDLKMKQRNKQFQKGMSGSIITIGDYPIGMLLSVEGSIGTALRIDTMNDVTKSVVMNYATEKEKIELGHYDSSNATNQKSEEKSVKKVIRNDSVSKPTANRTEKSGREFKGKIAKGVVVEHKILARGNTAYRISNMYQSDGTRITMSLLDPIGNKVTSVGRWDTNSNKKPWGFGVSQAGEYTLRLTGSKGSGSYRLKLEILATPNELMASSNVLGNGDIAKGKIAKGTFAEYKILARGNTAYRITNVAQVDGTRLTMVLSDPAGNNVSSVSRWDTKSTKKPWGFGVSQAGEYTLRLTGSKGSGSYNLKLEILATPDELMASSNVLGNDDIAKGQIAKGTFAEYKILARGNTAYRITNIAQLDETRIAMSLIDPDGNQVSSIGRWNTKSNNKPWEVGIVDAGEYTLRVEGKRGSGSFAIKLEQLSD